MAIPRRLPALWGLCLVLGGTPSAVPAQSAWPNRAVKLIVPSSPGGGTDYFGRFLAQALPEEIRQQFIVENRPGASGNIGAEAVAKAPADGYTFLVTANASVAIGPSLYKQPFNVERDFVVVARGVTSPLPLVVDAALGVKTLAEFVALAKREEGKLAYGSAGTGTPTYLGVRLFEEASGTRFLHVPYKGVGMALQGMLGGQIKFMLPDLGAVLPHVRSGKFIALAVNERTHLLPNVPTFAEAGYPLSGIIGSFSVFAPAGTPPDIVHRMSVAMQNVMRSATHAGKLEAQGLVPVTDTPAAAAASFRKERELWAALIKRQGIVAD
jgi:tripartite-type tricarboxylate transporter receptor subunit TctC